jgi:RNA polymerase-binding transcription factor DksA
MDKGQTIIEDRLRKRHFELSERLRRIVRDGRHAGGLTPDFEEQATERENDDVLARLDTTIRGELRQIEETLDRIRRGRYGICDRCGRPIPASRLEILPYAARCVRCEGKSVGI